MTSTPERTGLTLEEFWALPEGETPYELVDGRAIPKVSPKYFHSSLQKAFLTLIGSWCKGKGRVRPEWAVGLQRKGVPWVPTPDLTYISYERLPQSWRRNEARPVPCDLVIEIISPGQRGCVTRNLILGAIAGLLAGMGAALLVEKLDNVFHSPEDLKDVTKLPLLGVIPFHKHIQSLAPVGEANVERNADGENLVFRNINKAQSESYFPFLEAFRSLHTNIGFLSSDTPIHSLVISSAVHADGKSTVSVNLAQAAAAMGQRVLLVDADLRRPQIHTRLALPNEQGLSNVISTNLPVLDVIQRSPLWENLFVLTSGQIPPDPTKLLSSKKMQNIMELLRQNFDLVIYDTPPLLGLADSCLLANLTDGIVLVARMGKTDRSVFMQALDRLKISRSTVLGTVCNGVKNYNNAAVSSYYYRPSTAVG